MAHITTVMVAPTSIRVSLLVIKSHIMIKNAAIKNGKRTAIVPSLKRGGLPLASSPQNPPIKSLVNSVRFPSKKVATAFVVFMTLRYSEVTLVDIEAERKQYTVTTGLYLILIKIKKKTTRIDVTSRKKKRGFLSRVHNKSKNRAPAKQRIHTPNKERKNNKFRDG